MAVPLRIKRTSIVLIAVLALVLLGIVAVPTRQFEASHSQKPEDEQHEQVAGSELDELPLAIEGMAEGAEVTGRLETRTRVSGKDSETTRPAASQPVNIPVSIPHDVEMQSYKRELWADIEANPPPYRRPGDPEVDADLAYRLYMYYGNCSVVPRTPEQVDERLQGILTRVDQAGLRRLEGLEGRVDELVGFYELCSAIPPDIDRRLEAVAWMTEAVRLEHEIAEVQFYTKAVGFIMRPDQYLNRPALALLEPGLTEQFKDTARLGLTRAMKKGHPEAYLTMSQAVLEGMIYPRDPQLAFAYATAAERAAAQSGISLGAASYWKEAASQYLDQEQVAEANRLALALLDAHTGP